MDKDIISKSINIGGKEITLEVGRFAQQASAAVLVKSGGTVVLVTVTSSPAREDIDYFPLSVEYIERFYAGGKIKGSRWVKREGRPSDEAILTARLIDRSIRPLFPKEFKAEVQVVATVLSIDRENDPRILSIIGASAALAISELPWDGPIGSVCVGMSEEGDFIANPIVEVLENSPLDLVISGLKGKAIMLEGGASELDEETLLKAVEFGQAEIDKIIDFIKELAEKIGKKKIKPVKEQINPELVLKIEKEAVSQIDEILEKTAKNEGGEAMLGLKQTLVEKYEEDAAAISEIVDNFLKKAVREKIIKTGKRADGRSTDQIREITVEVGVLPRTHGSAMFKRGATQALSIATLGSPSLSQLIESMEGEETKRYIHHYNFPPYSVGEVGRIGYPSRREIGHGALAERALLPVLPSEEDFPYTIMVVTEIVSSNGSTSMAATCGSSLALMDAGVGIKAAVAGIAMGLIDEGDKKVVLTDIIGLEDFNGDMDFKLAGTKTGVTAVQMDVKNKGIDLPLLREIVEKAKKGRLFILDKMLEKLPSPRKSLSQFAPKIKTIMIPPDKIGDLIGPGGKTIKKLIKETECEIDVDDDGRVNVSSISQEAVKEALEKIEALVKEVEVGQIYEGKVIRLEPFGAFVEILPGKAGLVHVSNMAERFVSRPEEVVKIGDVVKVKVFEIDNQGRINLTMQLDSNPASNRKTRNSSGRSNFRRRSFAQRRR